MCKKDEILEPTPENIDGLSDVLIHSWDAKNLGVFISLMAYKYIQHHDITKKDFLDSLSKSIDKLKGY